MDRTLPHNLEAEKCVLGAILINNEAFNQAQQGYNDSGAVPYYLRSPERFTRFFEGLELVAPGVVFLPYWRPDVPVDSPPPAGSMLMLVGLARKP